jgi:hypothetical protein
MSVIQQIFVANAPCAQQPPPEPRQVFPAWSQVATVPCSDPLYVLRLKFRNDFADARGHPEQHTSSTPVSASRTPCQHECLTHQFASRLRRKIWSWQRCSTIYGSRLLCPTPPIFALEVNVYKQHGTLSRPLTAGDIQPAPEPSKSVYDIDGGALTVSPSELHHQLKATLVQRLKATERMGASPFELRRLRRRTAAAFSWLFRHVRLRESGSTLCMRVVQIARRVSPFLWLKLIAPDRTAS